MKKFVLFFALLVVGYTTAEAQNNQETIYLKNGSIVKGIILKEEPNGQISMTTSEGNFFVFNKDEIDNVVYGANNSVRKHYSLSQKNQHRLSLYHTYRGFVDTGLAFDLSDSDGYFSCSTSHGYQFNPHLFLGGGFAINYYFDASEAVIPVFADFRYYITKRRITPYIGTKLDYSISKYGDEYAE